MFRSPLRVTRARTLPGPDSMGAEPADDLLADRGADSRQPGFPVPDNAEAIHDERLMAAAREGDLNAFNQIVERHERAVFGVCLRLLRDVTHAEDASQDTFIRAWNAMGSFRGGLVRPWLLRIATNRAYDILRARARRPSTSLDAEAFEIEPSWTSQITSDDTPEVYAARAELSVHLEQALAVLPDDQRLAIILSDIQGYSYDDIAEIANVAVGTIKSRISRGRTRLRDELSRDTARRELFDRFVRSP